MLRRTSHVTPRARLRLASGAGAGAGQAGLAAEHPDGGEDEEGDDDDEDDDGDKDASRARASFTLHVVPHTRPRDALLPRLVLAADEWASPASAARFAAFGDEDSSDEDSAADAEEPVTINRSSFVSKRATIESALSMYYTPRAADSEDLLFLTPEPYPSPAASAVDLPIDLPPNPVPPVKLNPYVSTQQHPSRQSVSVSEVSDNIAENEQNRVINAMIEYGGLLAPTCEEEEEEEEEGEEIDINVPHSQTNAARLSSAILSSSITRPRSSIVSGPDTMASTTATTATGGTISFPYPTISCTPGGSHILVDSCPVEVQTGQYLRIRPRGPRSFSNPGHWDSLFHQWSYQGKDTGSVDQWVGDAGGFRRGGVVTIMHQVFGGERFEKSGSILTSEDRVEGAIPVQWVSFAGKPIISSSPQRKSQHSGNRKGSLRITNPDDLDEEAKSSTPVVVDNENNDTSDSDALTVTISDDFDDDTTSLSLSPLKPQEFFDNLMSTSSVFTTSSRIKHEIATSIPKWGYIDPIQEARLRRDGVRMKDRGVYPAKAEIDSTGGSRQDSSKRATTTISSSSSPSTSANRAPHQQHQHTPPTIGLVRKSSASFSIRSKTASSTIDFESSSGFGAGIVGMLRRNTVSAVINGSGSGGGGGGGVGVGQSGSIGNIFKRHSTVNSVTSNGSARTRLSSLNSSAVVAASNEEEWDGVSITSQSSRKYSVSSSTSRLGSGGAGGAGGGAGGLSNSTAAVAGSGVVGVWKPSSRENSISRQSIHSRRSESVHSLETNTTIRGSGAVGSAVAGGGGGGSVGGGSTRPLMSGFTSKIAGTFKKAGFSAGGAFKGKQLQQQQQDQATAAAAAAATADEGNVYVKSVRDRPRLDLRLPELNIADDGESLMDQFSASVNFLDSDSLGDSVVVGGSGSVRSRADSRPLLMGMDDMPMPAATGALRPRTKTNEDLDWRY
ncbi:hypothetical protein BDR26DRAFT_861758 [Obelidium mucronatum]|nr:hypothetical protein BDR26DRAFT_861758 [Obelidium mucronatum]